MSAALSFLVPGLVRSFAMSLARSIVFSLIFSLIFGRVGLSGLFNLALFALMAAAILLPGTNIRF